MGPVESTEEFDASLYTAEFVTAAVDEPLPEILERVEEAWTRTPNVVLVIPRSCQAFKDTHDFLALGKLPGARQVRVSVASPDPMIAGLARVLGFYIIDLPDDHPAMLADPARGMHDEDSVEKPTSPLPLGSWGTEGMGAAPAGSEWVLQQVMPVPLPKKSSLITSTWLGDPADYEAPAAVLPAPGPQPNAGPVYRPSRPLTDDKQTGRLVTADLDDDDAPGDSIGQASLNPEFRGSNPTFRTPTTPSGRIKARSVMVPVETQPKKQPRGLRYGGGETRPFRWARALGVVSAIVVLSMLASLFYAFAYLPEATISLTPQFKYLRDLPVEITIVTSSATQPGGVGVSAPLASPFSQTVLTATVAASPVGAEIVEEGARPASGVREEPRGRAQGTMSFVNREPQAVQVPRGTQFTTPSGVKVQTTEGGTVPATNFSGGTFGRLTLSIEAMVDGPDGNLREGAAAGVWKGLVEYYSSALQGGSMQTIQVVTQEDIDALTAQLRQQAEKRLYSVVAEQVADGQKLITQTVALNNVVAVSDIQAGQDGAEVKVRLTAQAQAFVYQESAVQDAVRQAVIDHVDRTEWHLAEPRIPPETVDIAPPTLLTVESGRVLYTTAASGRISYSITGDLVREIRNLVKGKDIPQARASILEKYGMYVKPSTLQARVLWFTTDRIPSDPNRINVLQAGQQGISAP